MTREREDSTPVTMRKAAGMLGGQGSLGEGMGYLLKRRVLGKPLINAQLGEQRLTKPLALGVLSPDAISSSAYGTEEILIELLKGVGLAAFALVLPITAVVLFVLVLVTLSYREVVMVYTRAGGSYVVARDNFGPRIAQIAAVALLIDYTVTVAVQTAAGTVAVVSAIPALGPFSLEITVGMVLLLCFGNLRGIREAGKSFAVPTYIFSVLIIVMIVTGLIREVLGRLPRLDPHHLTFLPGQAAVPIHSGGSTLVSAAVIFVLLRSFANGGSSLTGVEAISNGVSAFRPPEGLNARRVLVVMACILGSLIAGVSWLAHVTRATPRANGFPSVLAQEAHLVFGGSLFGKVMFYLVQAASALILYTGGNTSFNGFPFLASFVAEDAFLPRWLTKRGHRLVFSNGIVVLTVVSIILLVTVGANVNSLVPFYAIGVFTGFAMAGFGMARYHVTHREQGWRYKRVINFSAGVLSALVVVIFAITKFTEGAWVVVILFPALVFVLIRLNREYRMESRVLANIGARQPRPDPVSYSRRTVYVFVDEVDLATLAGLRYARSLRPTSLHAVHFVIDSTQADTLREDWVRANTGVALDFKDCADRRLARAAAELVARDAALPGVGVTAIFPRRSFAPLLGRLLHDRTADKMAGAVSRIPHAAATIVPFDVQSRLEALYDRQPAVFDRPAAANGDIDSEYERPVPPPGMNPIGSLTGPGRAAVEGRVRAVEIRPVERNAVLAVEIADSTGDLTALFYGRSHIPGMDCGARVRFRGQVGIRDGAAVMINPAYELLAPGSPAKGS